MKLTVPQLPLQDAVRNNEAICRASKFSVEIVQPLIERQLYAGISGV